MKLLLASALALSQRTQANPFSAADSLLQTEGRFVRNPTLEQVESLAASAKENAERVLFLGKGRYAVVPASVVDKLNSVLPSCDHPMDVTEHPACAERHLCHDKFGALMDAPLTKTESEWPQKPGQTGLYRRYSSLLSKRRLERTIDELVDLKTRYYTTKSGVEAPRIVLEFYRQIAESAGRLGDVEFELFPHATYDQPSYIVRVKGSVDPETVIVLGSHVDSTSDDPTVFAPGADDDASGTANILSVFEALMQGGYKPRHSLHFVGYAAEEVGLLGSQDVAQYYLEQGIKVQGVLQLDMTGYRGKNKMALITDNVDIGLTEFVASMIDEYVGRHEIHREKCHYSCSDHASWHKRGFSTVMVSEGGPFGDSSPHIHTQQDVVANVDFDYMLAFSETALAYALELDALDY